MRKRKRDAHRTPEKCPLVLIAEYHAVRLYLLYYYPSDGKCVAENLAHHAIISVR